MEDDVVIESDFDWAGHEHGEGYAIGLSTARILRALLGDEVGF